MSGRESRSSAMRCQHTAAKKQLSCRGRIVSSRLPINPVPAATKCGDWERREALQSTPTKLQCQRIRTGLMSETSSIGSRLPILEAKKRKEIRNQKILRFQLRPRSALDSKEKQAGDLRHPPIHQAHDSFPASTPSKVIIIVVPNACANPNPVASKPPRYAAWTQMPQS